MPARLTWEQVRRYEKVIVPSADIPLNEAQQRVVDRLRKENRLAMWTGPETLASLPTSWVGVAGAGHLRTSLRRDAKGGSAVCHLLNRDYDAAADHLRPTGAFTVVISEKAIGRELSKAVLYIPEAEPQLLKTSRGAHGLTIEVPSVARWGVLWLTP